jgi:hypothetical protein
MRDSPRLTNHCGIIGTCLAGCVLLALSVPAWAQVMQQMGTFPRHHHSQGSDAQDSSPQPTAPQPPPNSAPAGAPVSSAALPPSILDRPPEPAKVELAQGHLSIEADNSSLADILHKLTADSGMTVEGLGADQRIFGNYGPGNPQDVLTNLLDGSGYNVMMVGLTSAGTPKQLSLTPRVGGISRGGGMGRPQQVAQDEDNDDEVQQQPPPQEMAPASPPQPPQGNPPQNGVRSPQQMLQELQQMRQQQLQQQQQQQQGQPPQQP